MKDDKKPVNLKITNPRLVEYLKWLNHNTPTYGNRPSEAAWKLLQDQLDYLIDSGKFDRLGQHGKAVEESNRFTDKKSA